MNTTAATSRSAASRSGKVPLQVGTSNNGSDNIKGSGSHTSDKGRWYGKPTASTDKGAASRSVPIRATPNNTNSNQSRSRFGRQLQLCFPGEFGSGVARPRQSGTAQTTTAAAAPAARSASSVPAPPLDVKSKNEPRRSDRRRSDGTLAAFLKPVRPDPARELEAHLPSTSTPRTRQEGQNRSSRRRNDRALAAQVATRAKADSTAFTSAAHEAATAAGSGKLGKVAPATLVNQHQSIFGFGALPRSPPPSRTFDSLVAPALGLSSDSPAARRPSKRKLVIPTSSPQASTSSSPSPDKALFHFPPMPSPEHPRLILAGPSSPRSMSSLDDFDGLPLVSGHDDRAPSLMHTNILCSSSPTTSAGKIVNQVNHHQRSGSRITWDTQNGDETMSGLGRTGSDLLIEEQLINRHPQASSTPRHNFVFKEPRRAPSVHDETTEYMDLFRDEEYSPVQYTMTESGMDNLRRMMLGTTSPVKRRTEDEAAADQPQKKPKPGKIPPWGATAHHQDKATVHVASHLNVEAVSQVDEQRFQSFDESATEQSEPPPQVVLSPQRASQLQQGRNEDEAAVELSAHEHSGLGTSPHKILCPFSGQPDQMMEEARYIEPSKNASGSEHDDEETIPSTQPNEVNEEEFEWAHQQEVKESMLAPVTSSKVSVADLLPSQLLEYPETVRQEHHASMDEVQDQSQLRRLQFDMDQLQGKIEPNTILESPQHSPVATGRVLAPDSQAEVVNDEMDTQDILVEETCARRGATAKDVPSLRERVSSAWFEDVLSTRNPQEASQDDSTHQTSLTDFFACKPGGPSGRATDESKRQESFLARMVGEELRKRIIAPKNGSGCVPPPGSFGTRNASLDDGRDVPGLLTVDACSNAGRATTETPRSCGSMETQFVPSSQTQLVPGFTHGQGMMEMVDGREEEIDDEEDKRVRGGEAGQEGSCASQVLDSEGEEGGDEDDLDPNLSISSCEGWVEGVVDKVPTPVKKRRLRMI